MKFSISGELLAAKLLLLLASMPKNDLDLILSLFQKTNDIFINSAITSQQWSENWEKVKEATVSSISGLYFGHYKV